MARANKYTSINFNHVYEKSLTNNPTSNASNSQSKQPSSTSSNGLYSVISSPNAYKNHLSSSRSHGRMFVLTRPAPKTLPSITTPPPLSSSPKTPLAQQFQLQIPDNSRSEPKSDSISLRPLGRTRAVGISPVFVTEREKEVVSPKPDKFVPPHLRPGFAGREAKPGPEVFRGKEQNHRQPQQLQKKGYFVSPVQYREDGRPKSGGYDRRGRGGDPDPGLLNRPRSSGYRPNSSG